MNFRFWRKWNPVYPLLSAGKMGNPAWSKFNKTGAAQIHNNVDVVFSCIDLIATEASQARFKVVSEDSEGNQIELGRDHPLQKLLDDPNPTQDQSAFIHAAVSYRLITGDSYVNLNTASLSAEGITVNDDFESPPQEMWAFRPDRMAVVPGDRGVKAYKYNANTSAQTIIFPANEITGQSNILHWKTFNPLDDFYGLSPIQAAMKGIDTYSKTVDWNKSLLDNGGRPSGILTWKGEGRPGEESINQLKTQIDENITNKSKRGRPLVGGNWDWKDLSLSPRDMDFITSKDTSSRDIARVFKLPPILLNIGSDSTFSNMKEARLALWDDAEIPMLQSYVSMLNSHVAPRYGDGIKIKLDLDSVTALEPRRESQWDRAEKASGFITVNEQRRMIGLEDVDDGDVILVNASQIPLTFAATGLGEDPTEVEKALKKKVRD